ncbi:sodium hydrogen exchanger [Phaffia rhodozyma]|uniref:Sodium/hydrogen exchanger n=1 Tax=Phaffia rhodozyma TaxID=264483 RepID=A0A0F7SQ94_PHARH|nr:sodium hydrogen exchanger [Phaffia rhodozyma]
MSSSVIANPTPEEEETYSTWALTILCFLLIGALWTSYYLQVRKIRAIHETVISIFAGMVVGLVLKLSPGHMIREMLAFKHTLFFNVLLPPIILNSGYELKQDNFFRNFGVILTFAFAGTFISAVGLGVLVYLWSFTGLENVKLTLLECLIFGSTLSATDPVTILSIFNSYKVDPKLYSIIFGESLINDAVSIVLYETLSQFSDSDTLHFSSFFHGVAIFLLQFSISMALGVASGLLTSLVLKHSQLRFYPGIESCLVTLVAFTSYFMSTGLHMSGVVSLLFCGITLKHYAYHSMSRRTQRTTKYMFAVLAQLSENFIFIYLGLALFAQEVQVFKPLFILVTAISVMAARYAAVFPLSEIINWVYHARGQRYDELPHSYQMMMFWAGLRGAVGVALAVGLTGENANALRTTVLVVVVLTVIIFGGTTARMLEVLGIRVGVEEADGSSDEEGPALPAPYGPSRNRNAWNDRSRNSSSFPSSRRFAGSNGRSLRRGVSGGYEDSDNDLEIGGLGNGSGYNSPLTGPGQSSIRPNGFRTSSGLYGAPPRTANALLASPSFRGETSLDSSDGDLIDDEEEDEEEEGEMFPHEADNRYDYFDNQGSQPQPLPGEGEAESTTLLEEGSREGMVFRDGEWFTSLDERYLLPLFTNSVASRRHHARKASRRSNTRPSSPSLSTPGSGGSTPLGGGLESNRGPDDGYTGSPDGSSHGTGLGLFSGGVGGVAGNNEEDLTEEGEDRAEVDSQNGKCKTGDSRATFGASMTDFFNGYPSSPNPSTPNALASTSASGGTSVETGPTKSRNSMSGFGGL